MQRYAPIFNLSTREIEKDDPLILGTVCTCTNDDHMQRKHEKSVCIYSNFKNTVREIRQKSRNPNSCEKKKPNHPPKTLNDNNGKRKMQMPFSQFCDDRMSVAVSLCGYGCVCVFQSLIAKE